ncbi:MAG: 3-dehydroquinate synthase [Actinobacteria bacterium]|nr:3-dehydroquinate synthase [Actinomycetota bacterium]
MISYRTSQTTKTYIYIGNIEKLFDKYGKRHFRKGRKVHLLFDEGIPEELKAYIYSNLEKHVSDLETYFLPQGENSKNAETVIKLIRNIIQSQIKRSDIIAVAGGGAVLDAGNFIASVLLRGVSSILFPTTLLAMVDASIGGKNALNVDAIKNQVGTFHQPEAIFMDLQFLSTLPEEEFKSGLGEVIKTLLLTSNRNEIKKFIQNGVDVNLIEKCARFKAKIVKQDPFEKKGKREILNFGHTVGHAIESATAGMLKHGIAVAIGLYYEQKIAEEYLKEKGERIENVSSLIYELLKSFDVEEEFHKRYNISPFLRYDKKVKELGLVRFIYLEKLGKPRILSMKESEFLDYFERIVNEF